MLTFLLILAGLISFNFILLTFSIQSVDGKKKTTKVKRVNTTPSIVNKKQKSTGIAEAA